VPGSERLEGREGLLAEAELGVDGRPVLRLVSSLRFTLCDMSCGDEVGVGVFKVFRAHATYDFGGGLTGGHGLASVDGLQ